MTELAGLTIAAARRVLESGDASARELTAACIEAITCADPALNVVAGSVDVDRALAMAEASDVRRARGEVAPLEGIPVGIKDIFCVRGSRTGACSRSLDGFVPDYESTVTERLWQAGAIMAARLNMDEFAMGSSNETSCHGPVVNPWRRRNECVSLSPGGSSGGSAAAVAAGLVPAAVGTDTGGSIRQPASLTGTVGMKPSYGRASRYGMIAFSSSLDQAGVLTRTVADAATLLGVICGADDRDSTSLRQEVPDFCGSVGRSIRGLRIGVPREYRLEGSVEIERLWNQATDWLSDAGAEIVPISLPHTCYALPTYYIISPAEASSNLARYDGMRFGSRVEGSDLVDTYEKTRAAGFGDEVQRRLLIGGYVLSSGYYDAYFLRAQKVRARVAADFDDVFDSVQAIVTPTTPAGAFALGEKISDPLTMYLNDVFTVPASLAGLPAMSVPAMLDGQGLPLGMQVIGARCDEASVFRVAAAIETAAGFSHRPEPWW